MRSAERRGGVNIQDQDQDQLVHDPDLTARRGGVNIQDQDQLVHDPDLTAAVTYRPRRGPTAGGRCASSPSSSSGPDAEPSWTPRGSAARTPTCGQNEGCRGRGLRRKRKQRREEEKDRGWG
ncbi:hypothetical protein EYF80_045038 [Liparis tanakae]|uniref:Uncharacterized protein n=1 Tax=Liparis tanakae TaxID=230148 RepID=A0A4Z2FUG1_9TELE|nr:hypothetical protein EYF80_045038 [Liparis tanakae]